jgi:hypothetical protein
MDRRAAARGARAPRRSQSHDATAEEAGLPVGTNVPRRLAPGASDRRHGQAMAMSAGPSHDEAVLPDWSALAARDAGHGIRQVGMEATLAAVAFAALCVVVLSVPPQIAEPDDGAYHHSIVGITMGHYLTLSPAQIDALDTRIGAPAGQIPNQWVELTNGRYISEKDPGYPFLAAPFQALGIIRWAPLFYGALACLGLFIGARRWLGRFGGLAAMGLYCSSGATLAFAWRDYMPTFTDASLIAAGSGVLLWAVLAADARSRRRTWAGLAGFAAIEIATFVRYTNIIVLGCAVVAVIAAQRQRAARLPSRTLCWWLATAAIFGAGVAIFDELVYGGPLTTGYQPGEVTFGLGAIGPNLRIMPAHLMQAMPMLVLGLIALTWIIVRWMVLRRADDQRGEGGSSRSLGEPRRGRVVVRHLGPVLRVHLDGRPNQCHRAGRQVLPPGERRDLPARLLVGDQDSRPCMGRWSDLNRRYHCVVRPGRVGVPRHVRSIRRPTERIGIDDGTVKRHVPLCRGAGDNSQLRSDGYVRSLMVD